MSEFDEAVATAWQDWQDELAGRLAGLVGSFTLWREVEDATFDDVVEDVLTFCTGEDGEVRAQLPAHAVRGGAARLGRRQVRALAALGWERVGDRADRGWTRAVPAGGTTELASLAADTLRMVLGVVHPGFLDAQDGPPEAAQQDERADAGPPAEVPDGVPDGVFVEAPGNREELLGLLQRALEAHLGEPVAADEDGDFPVGWEHGTAWVRVAEYGPVLRVFATAVHDVRRGKQALVEVNLLNRAHPATSFTLTDDVVLASAELPVNVFASVQLWVWLDNFLHTLACTAPDLAERIGGRVDLGSHR